MSSQHTVVQKFWHHVFNSPSETGLLGREKDFKPSSLRTKKQNRVISIDNRSYGQAVALATVYLRKQGVQRGDRVAIFAWNCAEFAVFELAIMNMGAVVVPVYPNLKQDQAAYVLQDSGAKLVFGNEQALLDKVDPNSGVKTVLFSKVIAELDPKLEAAAQKEPFMSWFHTCTYLRGYFPTLGKLVDDEMKLQEKSVAATPSCGINRSDLAMLIYTSGSTGQPKGVMLTAGNFASACEGIMNHGIDFRSDDVYLSYLPAAHVYEQAAGLLLGVWVGMPTAFSKIDTMPDDIKFFRPTIIHGVPAVWRKIKEKAEGKIAKSSKTAKKIATWAFAQEKETLKFYIADFLVFRKIRAGLGGRVRVTTAGGAASSPEVIAWFYKIGIEILPGYGLSESTGASFVNKPAALCGDPLKCNDARSVGFAVGDLEVRIQPIEGDEYVQKTEERLIWIPCHFKTNPTGVGLKGYETREWQGTGDENIATEEIWLPEDILDQQVEKGAGRLVGVYLPQPVEDGVEGEIQMRGESIFLGYWNNEAETKKSFTDDGWFRTGDKGKLVEGRLFITGRIGRQIKTEGGKKVSPDAIENVLAPETLIQYVVPVGNGRPFVLGLIFVNQLEAKALTGETLTPEQYAVHPKVVEAVAAAVARGNKQLQPWETLKKWPIMVEEATIASGLLTPTLKIKTEVVLKRYAEMIEQLYVKPTQS